METRSCPECMAEIPRVAKRCSHCGAKVGTANKVVQVVYAVTILAIAALVVAVVWGYAVSSKTY